MSLTTRLCAFFLTALALVLAGFSVGLYLLARTYLYQQVDERLDAALETLAAAADVKSRGVEWEPHERQLLLGQEDGIDQVRWTVHTGRGKPIDHSRNLGHDALTPGDPADGPAFDSHAAVDRQGERWRVRQRRLEPRPPTPPARKVRSRQSEKDDDDERDDDHKGNDSRRHAVLVLTAGVSLSPVQATLRSLLVALATLSVGLWLLAAFVGRWLCRRALVPVRRMATTARAMSAADWEQRMPVPQTKDELEDLGRAFNDLLARLQEAFERQRRFTGDASHQLRTPLAAMLGQVEVALRRERPAEEYRQALGQVHGQAGQLRQIVEMLLFLARSDAEGQLHDLEVVSLPAWLADHVQSWSEHPRAADLHLAADGVLACRVRTHSALLGQLLDNLLDNAFKYSESGTPVEVRLGCTPDSVTLVVSDRGHGIPAEDLRHIFEPFYRSTEARRRGQIGCGLGLAVVERIATVLGGTLEVRSQIGYGTRLALKLPLEGHCPVAQSASNWLQT